ncbi:hypothetical protein KM043_005471 [Ampulex compressa]|nr:hypothetical protein KM043_005471 [Ampulex compressa]
MIVKVTLVCFLLIGSLVKSEPRPRPRPVPIYSNQFAVHVPEGAEAASEIAEKYGLSYHGQEKRRASGSRKPRPFAPDS